MLPSFIKTKKSEDDWKNSKIEETRKSLLKRIMNGMSTLVIIAEWIPEFKCFVFNDPDSIHGPNSSIRLQEEL